MERNLPSGEKTKTEKPRLRYFQYCKNPKTGEVFEVITYSPTPERTAQWIISAVTDKEVHKDALYDHELALRFGDYVYRQSGLQFPVRGFVDERDSLGAYIFVDGVTVGIKDVVMQPKSAFRLADSELKKITDVSVLHYEKNKLKSFQIAQKAKSYPVYRTLRDKAFQAKPAIVEVGKFGRVASFDRKEDQIAKADFVKFVREAHQEAMMKGATSNRLFDRRLKTMIKLGTGKTNAARVLYFHCDQVDKPEKNKPIEYYWAQFTSAARKKLKTANTQ